MRRAAFLAALPAVLCGLLAAGPALAQSINLDLGAEGGSATGQIIQLVALITVLSLAPSILVMMTSFTRIVVVLSFLRSALGIQQTPPNSVLISLALFLTAFVMMPTLQLVYDEAIQPLVAEEVDEMEALDRATDPVRRFMLEHVREQDLTLFLEMSGTEAEALGAPEETPMRALIPAFMISELKRAFEIGFLLFLPFVILVLVYSVPFVAYSFGTAEVSDSAGGLPYRWLIKAMLPAGFLLLAVAGCGRLLRVSSFLFGVPRALASAAATGADRHAGQ